MSFDENGVVRAGDRRPLTVYLDSQDISRFSPSSGDYESFLPVRNQLLALRDQGAVRFPFSDIHLFECLPTDPRETDWGIERVRTIAEFSAGYNLPNSGSLIEFEVKSLIAKHNRSRSRPTLSNEWFGDLRLPGDTWDRYRSSIKDHLKDLPGLKLNRKLRRAAMKKVGREVESMSNAEFAAGGLDGLMEVSPFRPTDKGRLLLALRNQGSQAGVTELLRDGLRDIENFAHWMVANWERSKGFVENLRSVSDRVQTVLDDFFAEITGFHTWNSGGPSAKVRATELKRSMASLQLQWRESFPAALMRGSLGHPGFPDGMGPSLDPTTTPSLFAMLDFFSALIDETARSKFPRNPDGRGASDFRDGLHVLYSPRVNIFRADKFAASVLARSQVAKSTVFAKSLKDLPALISDQLSQVP